MSVTPAMAPDMLTRVVPVLCRWGVGFKFASDTATVRMLGSRECDRASAGKVVTVYPDDDRQAIELAADLHTVTAGLPGPRILSDRPYRPDSVVHYRYGGFGGGTDLTELDNDGMVRAMLRTPNGSTVPDRRHPWFSPPPWASDPFAGTTLTTTAAAHAGDVHDSDDADTEGSLHRAGSALRLGGRYAIRTAIRHSTKGGVYLGMDERTGRSVVIKHARAFTEADLHGGDARAGLLHEAALLRRLTGRADAGADGPLRVPEPLAVFAADRDLFLVQERIAGIGLHQWVERHTAGPGAGGVGVPEPDAVRLVRRLLAAVTALHAEGLVLRDMSPGNVLVTDDECPTFVDLEAATPTGECHQNTGTPGYRAPELAVGGRSPAAVSDDYYSLGALMFLMATGTDPVMADDDARAARSPAARLAERLALAARHGETARRLQPVICPLLADRPSDRPDPQWVTAMLDGRDASVPPARATEATRATGVATPDAGRMLADGVTHITHTLTPDENRLWPLEGDGPGGPGGVAVRADPTAVQYGAAGVLAVLLRAVTHAVSPFRSGPAGLTGTVRKAATWLGQHASTANPSPGLYFGRAGTAWVLADAGDVLDDPTHTERAAELARSLPDRWPNPDVTHGLAGAILARLHVAHRTGERGLLDPAGRAADTLRLAARPGPGGPTWTVPADFDSRLAGVQHYGFAHGSAGIAYTLLAAGIGLDRPELVELAVDTADGLCKVARLDAEGAAWWPVGPSDPDVLPHWCSGSSGIGTFLLRVFVHTGEERFAEYARAAAGSVHRSRWRSGTAACHGLAGDGQFLLDAAEFFGEPCFRAWAEDLVPLLATRHCVRGGHAVAPDETGAHVTLDYGTGLAGVLAWLVRLEYGGGRLFMLDDFLDPDDVEASASPARPR